MFELWFPFSPIQKTKCSKQPSWAWLQACTIIHPMCCPLPVTLCGLSVAEETLGISLLAYNNWVGVSLFLLLLISGTRDKCPLPVWLMGGAPFGIFMVTFLQGWLCLKCLPHCLPALLSSGSFTSSAVLAQFSDGLSQVLHCSYCAGMLWAVISLPPAYLVTCD